jgi:hypothetical protein
MSPELRAALEDAAKRGNRSLHSEIIKRLQQSLEPRHHLGSVEIPADQADAFANALSEALREVFKDHLVGRVENKDRHKTP